MRAVRSTRFRTSNFSRSSSSTADKMPISASVFSVVFASTLAGAAPAPKSIPPVTVDVTIATDLPPTLVTFVLEETDAVWRASGITFHWNHLRAGASIADAAANRSAAAALDVVIGHDRGRGPDAEHDRMPLGWITFAEPTVPGHEIYVSYENALAYLADARGVVGPIERMTVVEREMKLGRAMGRALAHELGHYLLASKVHTPGGLMQAVHTATDFFGYPRSGFEIDPTQRQTVADRLRREPLVASR